MNNKMEKITNSRIKELEKKIEKQEDEIKKLKKRSDTKMAKIKFIGVDFDPVEYKIGEDEINKYLNGGFEVLRDFQTAGGIVMALGKWKKRKDSAEKKKWNK